MKSIGLVMLVLNEEEFISESISSARPFVDSITVIDQNSTDSTARIVRGMPDVQYIWHRGNFKTHGERYFRKLALELCQHDWLLALDADEILSDGWGNSVAHWLEDDALDAIDLLYYHLMGSYEFHSDNSPFHSPRLVRNRAGLDSSPPRVGLYAHSYYEFNPQQVATCDSAAIFHCGYMKSDMAARWEFLIRRGDHGINLIAQEQTIRRLKADPFAGFAKVKPMDLPTHAYPKSIRHRVGKTYAIDFDATAGKIRGRAWQRHA